jgi:hypothetical protein
VSDHASQALAAAAAALDAGDPRTALVHIGNVQPRATEAWRARYLSGVALQQQDRADEAAAALSGLLRDAHCPLPAQRDALQRLADLCLNRFGDAGAARLLHQRLRQTSAHDLHAELAAIVADQYEGNTDASSLSQRLRQLAAQHLPQTGRVPEPSGSERQGFDPGAGSAPHARGAAASRPQHASRSTASRQARSRPRIGLISNQWCASPIAFLTLGAVREMARHADLVFFDRGGKADWANAAFQTLAHAWHDVRTADTDKVHRCVMAAETDALIDLSGWTDPTALQAVARRPAPRQLKWVGGQSATTGALCFDGFVADARQVPEGCEVLYSEPILRASIGYVTYTPPPYWKNASLPKALHRALPGVYAVAANPVKISHTTADFLRSLKPRRLLLIDNRWRHQQTRQAAAQRLGTLLDVAEFVTPDNHPEYLDALATSPATFVDTAPYSMGLAAVELRLLGKPVLQPPRPALRSISECHCAGHMGASGFGHHARLAAELLAWCRATRANRRTG